MTPAAALPLYSTALAALARFASPADDSGEARFLRDNTVGYKASPVDKALFALSRDLPLSQIELLAVVLSAAVETDLMLGRAIAHLQSPLGGSRPTLGLLAAALRDYAEGANAIAALLTGVAVGSGLLQISATGAPLAERSVSVPLPICLALVSNNPRESNWPGIATASEAARVPLPPLLLAIAKKQAAALAAGVHRTLILRSGSHAEAKSAGAEIARLLDREALFIDIAHGNAPPAGLGPWLLLTRKLPVFSFILGPGERKALPRVPHYTGPQLATCGPEGTIEADGGTAPGWTLAIAPRDERATLWEVALGNKALADKLSIYRHGSGRIAQLGRLARHQSLFEDRVEPRLEDIVTASWTVEGSGLDGLAQPLPETIADEALVMTPALREELNRLLLRCRNREGLTDSLGASASARYRPGFRSLFTGPSGTGKTLATGWLATQLGLPLFRVDLAAVTSKYIGETEKNLAQLLARAEHAEVILLFDEADSMFGKRTEVKESNDRFANAQTNYLLQRIESFDGIVFLTSNSRTRFDPAFFRRLDAIVEFPIPGPMERRSLWQSHLGNNHVLTQKELNHLSVAADLLGGNIRNAVLNAAVLARDQQGPIGYQHLFLALTDEYKKLSRQVPSELQRST